MGQQNRRRLMSLSKYVIVEFPRASFVEERKVSEGILSWGLSCIEGVMLWDCVYVE